MGFLPTIVLAYGMIYMENAQTRWQRPTGTHFCIAFCDNSIPDTEPLIILENTRDLGPEQVEASVNLVGSHGSTLPIQGKYYDIDLD